MFQTVVCFFCHVQLLSNERIGFTVFVPFGAKVSILLNVIELLMHTDSNVMSYYHLSMKIRDCFDAVSRCHFKLLAIQSGAISHRGNKYDYFWIFNKTFA